MHHIFLLFSLSALLLAGPITLEQMKEEKRVAYVIGNSNYDDRPINNAIENATKFKEFLDEYGFDVTFLEDATKRDMIKGLRQFSSAMQPKGIALFYYRGHLVQLKGKNYLIPLEASISSDYHILYEAIELSAITDKMEKAGNRLNILIIDANANQKENNDHSLEAVKMDKNSDIFLSSKPGKSPGSYPFTDKLMFFLAAKGVSNEEGIKLFQKKFPHVHYELSNEPFYFNLPNKLLTQEEKLWEQTLQLDSLVAYEAYLKRYPKAQHSQEARLKRDALQVPSAEANVSLPVSSLQSPAIDQREAAILLAAEAEQKRLAKRHARFIEPVMVLIKAGDGLIGSNTLEDTKPQHRVNFPKDFYIGRFEVTNLEYREFEKARNKNRQLPKKWDQDIQPAVNVSWEDAQAYAQWLSELSDKKYRLPTEEEWEYAAKAAQQSESYWQSMEEAQTYAWLKENAGDISHPVGAKKPNAWGLFDMSGNAWEWCQNTYTPDYINGAEDPNLKVMRGGSWFTPTNEVSLPFRGANVKDFKSFNLGFRLVREK